MQTTAANSDRYGGWLLLVVLVLAALLRLPGLETVPPPLNQDEASRGYDAWAILETGADRWGHRWPLFLESFGPGDYTAALTTYLTVPFVAILGPTPTAMRLPDALCGVLTVFLLYAWLRRQTNDTVALVAAAFLATDPWHIALSRTAHESGFAPFLLVLGLLALHRSGLLPAEDPQAATNRPATRWAGAWAFLAGAMFAAHTWVYPATRLFTPLFCIALAVVYRKHTVALLGKRAARGILACGAAGLLIGASPLIITAMTHPEFLAARSGAALLIHKGLPATAVIQGVFLNMAANFDPRYLFLQADEMSGVSIPNVGLHLPVLAPLLIIGLIRIVGRWRPSAWSRLLVAWLVLYPLPAAICGDWNPHPMRTVGGMLLYPIIAGVGGQWLITRLARLPVDSPHLSAWPRRAATLAAVLVAANLAHFAEAYYRKFPDLCRPGYQTAMVRAMQRVAKHADDADFVLVTNYSNQPYIYALLYGPIGPTELAATEKIVVEGRLGFHHVLRIGKYFFPPRDGSPEAEAKFLSEWRALPPAAQGLVIDVEGRRQVPPDEVLERIPVGDPRTAGQIYEIYRWQVPPMRDEEQPPP